jgi:DNA-binding NtrC family response regulator
MERLLRHPWPGNARQLKRFCDLLVARCQGRFSLEAFDGLLAELELSAERSAPAGQKSPRAIQLQPQAQAQAKPSMNMPRESLLAVPQTERRLAAITPSQVDEALRCAGGRKKDAAVLLGISRTSLWRLIRSQARVQES